MEFELRDDSRVPPPRADVNQDGVVNSLDVDSFILLLSGGWRCETWLFGSNYKEKPKSSDWETQTEMILPLFVAGVAESKPSTVQRVYYRLTEPREVGDTRSNENPSEWDDKTPAEKLAEIKQQIENQRAREYSESLRRVYIDAFDAVLASRSSLKTTNESQLG